MTKEEFARIEKDMIHDVEVIIPDFKKTIDEAVSKKVEKIVIHQDAFAADYQLDEFVLLGKAIKYAGIFGVTLEFHGKNRESLQ